LDCVARSPSRPYSAPNLEIESLIPFSISELSLIKANKIVKIKENEKTYYFTDGQLDSIIIKIGVSRKKIDIIQKTKYNYNSKGKLIQRTVKDIFVEYSDSIAYNKEGRIIQYYSYQIWNKSKKKKIKTVYHNLNLLKVENGLTHLVDSTKNETFLFTKENKLIKRILDYQIDSLFTQNTNDTIREIWTYKTSNDSTFKKGEINFYHNNLLVKNQRFSMLTGNYCQFEEIRIYNNIGQLIRIENSHTRATESFITYNDYGLKREVLTKYLASFRYQMFYYLLN